MQRDTCRPDHMAKWTKCRWRSRRNHRQVQPLSCSSMPCGKEFLSTGCNGHAKGADPYRSAAVWGIMRWSGGAAIRGRANRPIAREHRSDSSKQSPKARDIPKKNTPYWGSPEVTGSDAIFLDPPWGLREQGVMSDQNAGSTRGKVPVIRFIWNTKRKKLVSCCCHLVLRTTRYQLRMLSTVSYRGTISDDSINYTQLQ